MNCLAELHQIRVMFKKYRLDNLDDDQKKNLSSFQDQNWADYILRWSDQVFMKRLPINVITNIENNHDQQLRFYIGEASQDYEDEEDNDDEDADEQDEESDEQSHKENTRGDYQGENITEQEDQTIQEKKDEDAKITKKEQIKNRLNSIKARESQLISILALEELFSPSSNKKITQEINEDALKPKRDSQKTLPRQQSKQNEQTNQFFPRRTSFDQNGQMSGDNKELLQKLAFASSIINEFKTDQEIKSQLKNGSLIFNDSNTQLKHLFSNIQKGFADIMAKQNHSSFTNLGRKKSERILNRSNTFQLKQESFETFENSFDKFKEYKYYYPEFNMSVVMDAIKKKYNFFIKKWIEDCSNRSFLCRKSIFKK